MASSRLNFTKKAIEALKADSHRRLIYHDTNTPGLCLRIASTGRKSFLWRRKVNGQN